MPPHVVENRPRLVDRCPTIELQAAVAALLAPVVEVEDIEQQRAGRVRAQGIDHRRRVRDERGDGVRVEVAGVPVVVDEIGDPRIVDRARAVGRVALVHRAELAGLRLPPVAPWQEPADDRATALGGFLPAGALLDPVRIELPYPLAVSLASKGLVLSSVPGKPEKRGLRLAVSREPAVVAAQFDPVTNGALVRLVSDSLEHAYPLPASNWSPIVKKGVLVGYRYDDRQRLLGPITTARLLDGKLEIVGKGSGLLHDLAAEPVNLRFVLQSGSARFVCGGSGGVVKFKAGKSFKATKNPAPGSCPYYRP